MALLADTLQWVDASLPQVWVAARPRGDEWRVSESSGDPGTARTVPKNLPGPGTPPTGGTGQSVLEVGLILGEKRWQRKRSDGHV